MLSVLALEGSVAYASSRSVVLLRQDSNQDSSSTSVSRLRIRLKQHLESQSSSGTVPELICWKYWLQKLFKLSTESYYCKNNNWTSSYYELLCLDAIPRSWSQMPFMKTAKAESTPVLLYWLRLVSVWWAVKCRSLLTLLSCSIYCRTLLALGCHVAQVNIHAEEDLKKIKLPKEYGQHNQHMFHL